MCSAFWDMIIERDGREGIGSTCSSHNMQQHQQRQKFRRACARRWKAHGTSYTALHCLGGGGTGHGPLGRSVARLQVECAAGGGGAGARLSASMPTGAGADQERWRIGAHPPGRPAARGG